MIAIWINCSIDHKEDEDSLVFALICMFREILATNHINVVLFVDVKRLIFCAKMGAVLVCFRFRSHMSFNPSRLDTP